MLKIEQPKASVANRMRQNGVDKAIIDKMFGSGSANSRSGLEGKGTKTKKKEEPSLVCFVLFVVYCLLYIGLKRAIQMMKSNNLTLEIKNKH